MIELVKDHILPVIPSEQLLDQYGFKLTGSMTAAIVNIKHYCYLCCKEIINMFAVRKLNIPTVWFSDLEATILHFPT